MTVRVPIAMTMDEIDAIARLYPSRWYRSYARTKLRTDPLYEGVFAELRERGLPLLDIGCGLGLFAFFLRCRGYEGDVLGIDYDGKKVEAAEAIARAGFPRVRFAEGDARAGVPDFLGNVTVLDILQFFWPDERARLLGAAAAAVAPGGTLVVRNGVADSSRRYRITRAGDLFAKVTFWMKAAPVGYPTAGEICGLLEAEGLSGGARPLWGRTPFNNYLFVFRRAAGGGGG